MSRKISSTPFLITISIVVGAIIIALIAPLVFSNHKSSENINQNTDTPNHTASETIEPPTWRIEGEFQALDGQSIYTAIRSHDKTHSHLLNITSTHLAQHDASEAELNNYFSWKSKKSSGTAYFERTQDSRLEPQGFARGVYHVRTKDGRTETVTKLPARDMSDDLLDSHELIVLDYGHYIVQDHVPAQHNGERLWALYIQEIKNGKLVRDWISTDHPELDELATEKHYIGGRDDYLHGNSMSLHEGDLILSLENVNSIVKIEWPQGNVKWILGGAQNQFHGEFPMNTPNDVRIADGTLTYFDRSDDVAAGVIADINEDTLTISDVRAYTGGQIRSISGGSTRVLPNGNILVGWGRTHNHPVMATVFSPNGEILMQMRDSSSANTYRVVF